MLKTILSVSGKPGLYKLVSQGKNMLIVEALTDKKRIPVYANEKAISLGDIAIYTTEDEMPLHEVLTRIKDHTNNAALTVPAVSETDKLRNLFKEILPNYDNDRVYPSDIRKVMSWYNLLIQTGLTDFTPEETDTEKEEETVADESAE